MTQSKILVTGASGRLGGAIVRGLLDRFPADRVVATTRTDAAALPFRALGVEVRIADYEQPQTLDAAVAGIDTLMLVSAAEPGRRVEFHRNAIEAAVRAKIGRVVYTSMLRAGTSTIRLAREHRESEEIIRASGLPFVFLRNGWYAENYTAPASVAVAHGAVLGTAGDGRLSLATIADFAAAAVAVLTSTEDQAGRTYELAGDEGITLSEYAAELARQSGKRVVYSNLPEDDYERALLGFGLPRVLADLLADSDVGASKGELFDDGRQLSRLIGRPSTPLSRAVADALGGQVAAH